MRQTIPEIDLRPIVPRPRHPDMMDVLTALAPGGAMTVTSNHDSCPLRYQIGMRHPHQFDWPRSRSGRTSGGCGSSAPMRSAATAAAAMEGRR
jgi:uncharacterized protein (DUF2249 family)